MAAAITSQWLGTLHFDDALKVQHNVLESKPHMHILGCEHSPVITLGKRALREREVRTDAEMGGHSPIDVIVTDRGGLATVHSPGQLVN